MLLIMIFIALLLAFLGISLTPTPALAKTTLRRDNGVPRPVLLTRKPVVPAMSQRWLIRYIGILQVIQCIVRPLTG